MVDPPLQTNGAVGEIVTEGNGLTVTVFVVEFEQPVPDVPVTV